ncbi:MAG: hypothetical protein FWE70_07885, partial [Oscillospiraceae bacterium]|nr:hypothetical protein [Oscillospiraceae bacterium]
GSDRTAGTASEDPTGALTEAPTGNAGTEEAIGTPGVTDGTESEGPTESEATTDYGGPEETDDPDGEPLTYYEALDLVEEWIRRHPDLTNYSAEDWSDPPYEIPPPTFGVYGNNFYDIVIASEWDESYDYGFTHRALVHDLTGYMWSIRTEVREGERPLMTIEALDDWYLEEAYEEPEPNYTPEQALAMYESFMGGYLDDYEYTRLDPDSYRIFVIFGDWHYYFHSLDYAAYWYNVLIDMETGEMHYLASYDGMFGGTDIFSLSDMVETNMS